MPSPDNVKPFPDTVNTTVPKLGPGLTAPTLSFTNVTELAFDFMKRVINITHGIPSRITCLDDGGVHGALTYTVNANGSVTVAITWA